MKYWVPARDFTPELLHVCSLRPVHGLAGRTLGVYQYQVEHIVLDQVRDHVSALTHPEIDAGSFFQVPGWMVFVHVLHRDGDPVYDVARAEGRVFATEHATSAVGSLSVGTQDEVRFVDLAGGEAQGGLVEVDLADVAAQLDFYVYSTPLNPGEQRLQEVRAMNDDVRSFANQFGMSHRR